MKKDIKDGIRDSMPIMLGYFPVSFTFGLIAVSSGIDPFFATMISFTNFTSAGQFAGINIILAEGTYAEMIATMLVINLRYMLMSFSLSQKMTGFNNIDRLLTGFGITDEVFAVSSIKKDKISSTYLKSLILFPYIAWGGGTLLGALVSGILPSNLKDAMGIALYGMFLAIIVPVAKKDRKVFKVIIFSIIISVLLYYIPIFELIPAGWTIIISTILSSLIGAIIFPEVKRNEID